MAIPQQSLFGTMFQTPAQVEQAQQQRLFEQARQSAMMTPEQQGAFIAARSGQMTGRLLSGLAGYEDPELKKARDLQGIVNEVKAGLSAADQQNPAKVYAALAKRAGELGYTQEAMMLADEANRRGLEERKISMQEEEFRMKKEKFEQGDVVPNLVTKKGDVIVQKQGKMYVQTVDAEGTVKLEPYKKSVHGSFETKSEYAAAQAASGGVVRQPIVDPRTGFTTGYIILDRQGNELRRETFDGRPMGTGGAAAPQGGAAVPNIFQQALQERLAKEKK